MQILTPDQYKALSFVAAANRGGNRPNAKQVREWMLAPAPLPGKPGPLITPGKPAVYRSTWRENLFPGLSTPGDSLAELLGSVGGVSALSGANSVAKLLKTLGIDNTLSAAKSAALRNFASPVAPTNLFRRELVEPEVPPEYGPPIPAESFIDHLVRLEWLDQDERKSLGVTPLGRALMRSAEYDESDSEALEVEVLNSNDEMAYPSFVRRLAEMGDALLIDPYLRLEQLLVVKAYTTVSRVLISARIKQEERAAMAVLVSSGGDHEIELRVAGNGVLHDRMIVGRDSVLTIGTSINTIGRQHPTVLTPLPEVAADVFREHAEGWWDEADFLAAYPPYEEDEIDDEQEEPVDESGEGDSGST